MLNPTCLVTGKKDNLRMHALRNKLGDMVGWVFIHASITMEEVNAELKWNYIAKESTPTPEEEKSWDARSDWDEDGFDSQDQEPIDIENLPMTQTHRRKTECLIRRTQTVYRRAFSETQLLDVLGEKFLPGFSYHCITAGDVDSLSYLKCILRQQDLDYCLFSTWCMAADDILQLDEWLTTGRIKKLDAYVGEIFPGTYRMEYKKLKEIFERHQCGRIAVFRNHAKIYAGIGPKFAFGIETSANINTNPRTENGCITIDPEIYKFYRAYFDGIISFDKANEPGPET